MRALNRRPITSRIYAWRVNNSGSWVVTSPAVSGGKVYFSTSDSRLYQVVDALTGKAVLQQEDRAFIFSSPLIAGMSCCSASPTARCRRAIAPAASCSGNSRPRRRNRISGWVLTADRHFNNSLLYRAQWQDPTVVAITRLQGVGSTFSTPLVGDGVVYVTDGNLYAID